MSDDRNITMQVTEKEAEAIERMRLNKEWCRGYQRGANDAAQLGLNAIADPDRKKRYCDEVQALLDNHKP